MILSFKKKFPWGNPTNFKEKILSGTKIHTIREDKGNRWKPGCLIHMAYGVRTKFYECFSDKHRCQSTQEIKIWHTFSKYRFKRSFVAVDGKIIYRSANPLFPNSRMIMLAKNDGFDSVDDFFKWFSTDFEGKIIHWTDFKY